MKANKVLIWTLAIVGIGIASYATYAYLKKKKDEEASSKPRISTAEAKSIGAGIGSFISNLFNKDKVATDGTKGLDYELIPGVNSDYK